MSNNIDSNNTWRVVFVIDRFLSILLFVAALCSAVPSIAAFHPFTHARLSSDDDIMGLQDASAEGRTCLRAATRDRTPESNRAKQWRHLAEQARRLAKSMPDKVAQQKLLDLADGYDRLAKGAEEMT